MIQWAWIVNTGEDAAKAAAFIAYLLAPRLQVGAQELGVFATIAEMSSTALLVIGIWLFIQGYILTKSSVERERVMTEANHEREREAWQARYEGMEKSYLARLEDKDKQLEAAEQRAAVTERLVQESTLILGRATDLLSQNLQKAAG
jgi:flagellar biosynthesis component FlhA